MIPGVAFRCSVPCAFLVGALGLACTANLVPPRAQLLTLFDLVPAAENGQNVAAGIALPQGFPATKFVTAEVDSQSYHDLVAGHGFIDGQPATWATTELWLNFDQVWVQPVYRAMRNGALVDPGNAPWVFGVGPRSLFYSPFWEVYGFELPADVTDAAAAASFARSVLDVRAVVEIANRTGGLRPLGRRFLSLAPSNVANAPEAPDADYYHDTAAWDGVGNWRYIDFGEIPFEYDATEVVREIPFFIFAHRNTEGVVVPSGFPAVAGTRPLFSQSQPSPAGTDAGGAPMGANIGAFWRIYLVDASNDTPQDDGRVIECPPGGACATLDGQTAIEALGPDRIHRTEILTATPVFSLGGRQLVSAPAETPGPSSP